MFYTCFHAFVLMIKGCLSASAGVHLFSGFKFKQRSSRSTKRFNSLISASAIPFTLAINLCFKSRVGRVKLRIRTTSCSKDYVSWLVIDTPATSHFETAYLPCQFVLFHAPEIQQIIEMVGGKLSFPKYLVAEFAATFHDGAEHLIVAAACEQDFAGVELEQSTTD